MLPHGSKRTFAEADFATVAQSQPGRKRAKKEEEAKENAVEVEVEVEAHPIFDEVTFNQNQEISFPRVEATEELIVTVPERVQRSPVARRHRRFNSQPRASRPSNVPSLLEDIKEEESDHVTRVVQRTRSRGKISTRKPNLNTVPVMQIRSELVANLQASDDGSDSSSSRAEDEPNLDEAYLTQLYEAFVYYGPEKPPRKKKADNADEWDLQDLERTTRNVFSMR